MYYDHLHLLGQTLWNHKILVFAKQEFICNSHSFLLFTPTVTHKYEYTRNQSLKHSFSARQLSSAAPFCPNCCCSACPLIYKLSALWWNIKEPCAACARALCRCCRALHAILQIFATDGEELCVDGTDHSPECCRISLKTNFRKQINLS